MTEKIHKLDVQVKIPSFLIRNNISPRNLSFRSATTQATLPNPASQFHSARSIQAPWLPNQSINSGKRIVTEQLGSLNQITIPLKSRVSQPSKFMEHHFKQMTDDTLKTSQRGNHRYDQIKTIKHKASSLLIQHQEMQQRKLAKLDQIYDRALSKNLKDSQKLHQTLVSVDRMVSVSPEKMQGKKVNTQGIVGYNYPKPNETKSKMIEKSVFFIKTHDKKIARDYSETENYVIQ